MKKFLQNIAGANEEPVQTRSIDIDKDKLLELNNKFNEHDSDRSKSLDEVEFLSFMASNMTALSPLTNLIFYVFSDKKTKKISFSGFLEFYKASTLPDSDLNSVSNLIYSFYDKKNKGYLDSTKILNIWKILYTGTKYGKEFTKEKAEILINSLNPEDAKKGLTRSEFAQLYNSLLAKPQFSDSPHKRALSLSMKSDSLNTNSEELSGLQSLSIDFIFPKNELLHSNSIEAYQLQFDSAKNPKRKCMTKNNFTRLIYENCLIPKNYIELTLKVFGRNGMMNFDGYCAFRYALNLNMNDEKCYANQIFDLFANPNDHLMHLKEAKEFGFSILLTKEQNSNKNWENIIEESKLEYKVNGICYKSFVQFMFNLDIMFEKKLKKNIIY